MGRLERKLDSDLIERMDAGWAPSKDKPAKRESVPRHFSTYRGYRYNQKRGQPVFSKPRG